MWCVNCVLQASFSSFNTEKLRDFECDLLRRVLGSVHPLCGPSTFVQLIVDLCPPAQKTATILHTVQLLVSEFEEGQ